MGTLDMTRFTPTRPRNTPDFRDWLKDNPSPSLQDLVEKYGWGAIPPEIWADYDERTKDWNLRRISRP